MYMFDGFISQLSRVTSLIRKLVRVKNRWQKRKGWDELIDNVVLLIIKLWCYTKISSPEKSRNDTSESNTSPIISCCHVTRLTRHSVGLMNERQCLCDFLVALTRSYRV